MANIQPTAPLGSDPFSGIDTAGRGSLAVNPNYLMVLRTNSSGGNSTPITVVANAPEQFAMGLQNEWESMLSTFLGQSSVVGGGILKVTGMALIPQFLTAQVWKGTSPLELTLPFQFNAHDSAEKEVVQPIRDLIRIASPYRSNSGLKQLGQTILNNVQKLANDTYDGETLNFAPPTDDNWLLNAPGPSFVDYSRGKTDKNIQFFLGKVIQLESVVITNLQVEWDNRFTAEGWPISALATVTIKTHYTLDRNDLLARIFPGANVNGS